MSSVWAIGPSIRPDGGTLVTWKARGYKIAVLRQGESLPYADLEIPTDRYLGWARSINIVAKRVLELDVDTQWLVNANDDTLPDPSHAPEQIAFECGRHFGEQQQSYRSEKTFTLDSGEEAWNVGRFPWSTFGVMQATGDLALWPGSRIDKFAGSPWLGRDWCLRAYNGRGPTCEDFFHNWSDQHLQEVAEKLGVFWQRSDLIHQHNHAGRKGSWQWEPFQLPLQDRATWDREKAAFEQQRAAGFPGSNPLLALSLEA